MEEAAKSYGITNPFDLLAFGSGYACGRGKRWETEDYGDEEIYFGSVKCSFAEVNGDTIIYDHDDWKPCMDTLKSVMSRVQCLGPKKDILVPAIPALDVCRIDRTRKGETVWPQALKKPLIKVGKNITKTNQPGNGITKAYASGVRSAVVKVGQTWYRLKGCGNNDEGFIVKYEVNRQTKVLTKQIRGCAWMHTAMRENFMTSHLAKTLKNKGVFGVNVAMGAYRYGPSKSTVWIQNIGTVLYSSKDIR